VARRQAYLRLRHNSRVTGEARVPDAHVRDSRRACSARRSSTRVRGERSSRRPAHLYDNSAWLWCRETITTSMSSVLKRSRDRINLQSLRGQGVGQL
jgi:hypothetical protein